MQRATCSLRGLRPITATRCPPVPRAVAQACLGTAPQGAGGPTADVNGNRNPRSGELSKSKPVPRGFATAKHRLKPFYHRLRFTTTNRHTYANVDRSADGRIIVSASTEEYAIEKHLYSNSDVTAAANVGTAIATRLRESGITSVRWDRGAKKYHGKVKAFVDAVSAGGVRTRE